jgi:chromosome segregation ATPase
VAASAWFRGRALAVALATLAVESIRHDRRTRGDELEARARGSTAETRTRLQVRFDRLRAEEASAWAAVRAKAEAVDEKFRELEIDIAIAENRLASEMAEDANSFADAVEAELHDWDAAIERLQTRVATRAQEAREQAEAEIAALKQARNRAAERVTALRTSSDAWQGQKSRVVEALDELERRARDAAATFQ